MAKELCFEGITLKAFDEQYRSAINDFDLNERQQYIHLYLKKLLMMQLTMLIGLRM